MDGSMTRALRSSDKLARWLLPFVLGCSACHETPPVFPRKVGTSRDEPLAPPSFQPLNVPTRTVKLPAMPVGSQGQLSTACFNAASMSETESLDAVAQAFVQEKKWQASFKAAFEHALVEVGMDASLAQSFTQSWTLEAKGLKLSTVDPADVRPNFANQACTTKELGFFSDKRSVFTGALKAAELLVKAETSMDADRKAKLQAAITVINTKLGFDFSSMAMEDSHFELKGTNVYFGALASSLKVMHCELDHFQFRDREQITLCNMYDVSVRKLPGTDQFRWSVAKAGISGEFADRYHAPSWHSFGELQIAALNVGDDLRGRADVLLVGVSGQ